MLVLNSGGHFAKCWGEGGGGVEGVGGGGRGCPLLVLNYAVSNRARWSGVLHSLHIWSSSEFIQYQYLYNNYSETRNLIGKYRAGSDNPARKIYFIKHLLVFCTGYRDPCTWDVARLLESVKNTHLWLVSFTISESLATSHVHGSRYPARKTIWYPFSINTYALFVQDLPVNI